MVYRGKPGLGCAVCRKRRLTCDRRRPSCSQCLRVNAECYGYRDPNVLRIHDQTNEVAVKAKTRARKSSSPSSSPEQQPHPLTVHLPVSAADQALAHMFMFYVGTTKSQGIMSYLPDILGSDPSFALQASLKAVGLASLSNIVGARQSSREEYSVALLATNEALRDPVAAKSDSTLASVLLLSTYEMVTCQSPNMMHGWLNHVQGATRLLELRGEEQLNTRAGLEMFTTIRLQNVIGGVFFRLVGLNTPTIAELSKLAKARQPAPLQPVEDLYELLVELSDMAIEIGLAHLKPDPVRNLRLAIAKALHLDADMRAWAMSLGPFWRYTIVEDIEENNSPLYGDRYHVYVNVNVASLWNHYRQTRIVLNEMIRSMSKRLWNLTMEPESLHTVTQAGATIDQMIADIRASIPFHFLSGDTGIGGTYRLLWPLFMAAHCSNPESPSNDWVLKTFATIKTAMNMQQAGRMSSMLTQGKRLPIVPGTY